MAKRVYLYDATLRDGSQGEGISFFLNDKIRLSGELDRLGAHYIEGGWPGANPKDDEYFAAMRHAPLKHARLVAFGSTRHPGTRAAADAQLRAVASAGARIACIVGKASRRHVENALRTTPDENLRMVRDSVAWLKKRMDAVFFDAEHFFDGHREDPGYAMAVLRAALEAGADNLSLCDTNGGSLPADVAAATAAVAAAWPRAFLGIHAHNDGGLAVANTLAAVEAGATLVQGCLNGFGERCGAADLCQVIPNLELKMGRRVLGSRRLARLTRAARLAYEFACRPLQGAQPFVGHSAFAHKGGLHVSGVTRDSGTYEHIHPEQVGNARRILVSELSGRANIRAASPFPLKDAEMAAVLRDVRELELQGYTFDNASASFELLLRRRRPDYSPPFVIDAFRVINDNRRDRRRADPDAIAGAGAAGGEDTTISAAVRAHRGSVHLAEASIRVRIGEHALHTAAESPDGPVSALDLALRKALSHVYSYVDQMRLIDFQVHIVNAEAAAGARVRVVIQSRDGRTVWGTVGVSEDIMEASSIALRDSMEYLILRHGGGEAGRRRLLHRLPATARK